MVTITGTPKTFSQYVSEKTTGTSTRLVAAQADNTVTVATVTAFSLTLLDDASQAAARTTLGLTPGTDVQAYDADLTAIAAAGVAILSNYMSGLAISNNVTDPTNDIDIAVGVCMNSTNAGFMALASSLTKRLDAAWAVGSGNGGLDTGSIANAVYHIHLIKRVDTRVVDALFSLSATSPTLPASYTLSRRIGSIIRSGATILAFVQVGDVFTLGTAVADISATDPGTSAVTRTLTVPTGIVVEAFGTVSLSHQSTSANRTVLISALTIVDATPSIVGSRTMAFGSQSTAGTYRDTAPFRVFTNTSAQLRSRVSTSDANTVLTIVTDGWVDQRGRL